MNKRTKIISFLLLLCPFFLLCSSVPSYADSSEPVVSSRAETTVEYEAVLDSYFLSREMLYTCTTSDFDQERWAFIQSWKASLGITVKSANIEYAIVEVLDESISEIKLAVYEMVTINYVCTGYTVDREMIMGIEHIIRLIPEGTNYEFYSDSYYDVYGYEAGLIEDIELIKARNVEYTHGSSSTEDIFLTDQPTEMTPRYVTNSRYEPSAAITYSYNWTGNLGQYNPYYYYYGSDCCNFVSQCINAGGIAMDSAGIDYINSWWAIPANASSPNQDVNFAYSSEPWNNTQDFQDYWDAKNYGVTLIEDLSQAVPGNTIYWLMADEGETYNHNMLIVGFDENGNILANMHSPVTQNYTITLRERNPGGEIRQYYTICFVHDFSHIDTVVNYSYHIMECCACKMQYTGLHDIRYVDGVNRCIVCGFRP